MSQQHDSESVNKRTNLERVIMDTPALLNMIKNCRESDQNAHGLLMGVMQHSEDKLIHNLLVTQTMPASSKSQMQELLKAMEQES